MTKRIASPSPATGRSAARPENFQTGEPAGVGPARRKGPGGTIWGCLACLQRAPNNWLKYPASAGSWPKTSIPHYTEACLSICPSC